MTWICVAWLALCGTLAAVYLRDRNWPLFAVNLASFAVWAFLLAASLGWLAPPKSKRSPLVTCPHCLRTFEVGVTGPAIEWMSADEFKRRWVDPADGKGWYFAPIIKPALPEGKP